MSVELYYGVLEKHDLITRAVRVVNRGTEPVQHLTKAAGGTDHGRLRGSEGLAGGQGPAEMVGVDRGRSQLTLDFSRGEVRDHIYGAIRKVLDSADISYVKMASVLSLHQIWGV